MIDAKITIFAHILKLLCLIPQKFPDNVLENLFQKAGHLNAPSGHRAGPLSLMRGAESDPGMDESV